MRFQIHRFSLRATGLTAVALGGFASAHAQGLNIDLHDPAGTPTNAYAAAAPQPGHWNPLTALQPNFVHALADLSGGATSVTVVYTLTGGGGPFTNNNAFTTGDDEALMDDLLDIGGVASQSTFTFSGLNATNFDVYTYSWAPDDPIGFTTDVSVAGSPDPTQSVGGADWGGAHVLGETYAKHSVFAVGGVIAATVETTAGFGSINGFQLVETGGPSCAASFCVQTKPTSVSGCLPTLSVGDCSATSGLWTTSQVPLGPGVSSTLGLHLYTAGPGIGQSTASTTTPFGDLCLQGFFRVLPIVSDAGSPGSCTSSWTYDFGANFAALQAVDPLLQVGGDINVQGWYRDPPNAGAANFTNAVFYVIQ